MTCALCPVRRRFAPGRYFLREFVGEFVGKFDDVLTLSEEFMVAAGGGARDSVQELDEQQAHIFLEKRGEPITVKDMRDRLREIDLDMNHKVAFIEYMMFSSKKTLAELFADKPENMKALLAKLDEAIDSHNAVLAKRKAEADKEKELDELSKGTGVKALKAKAELEQLRARRQTALNMAEARAAALKRCAWQLRAHVVLHRARSRPTCRPSAPAPLYYMSCHVIQAAANTALPPFRARGLTQPCHCDCVWLAVMPRPVAANVAGKHRRNSTTATRWPRR